MKKLLSIFAAVAMLFGLASCSGDLHDAQAFTGYIHGFAQNTTTWDGAWDVPVVIDDAVTCHYDFTATDSLATNGCCAGIKASDWSKRWESPTGDYAVGQKYALQDTEPAPRGLVKGLISGTDYRATITYEDGVAYMCVTEK